MRLHAAGKRSDVLRGRVIAHDGGIGFVIQYSGEKTKVDLATVYLGAGGDTVYAVTQPVRSGTDDKSRQAWRLACRKWREYVPLFTPSAGEPTSEARYWRVRDGAATPCPVKPGVWRTPRPWTSRISRTRDEWAETYAAMYPKFPRRCRLFVTRLRKALAHGPEATASPVGDGGEFVGSRHLPSTFVRQRGPRLCVCTAPTATQDSRRLWVKIWMHDLESRTHHHVDGDYGYKHNQFYAVEEGKTWTDVMRWKCRKDAIVGIQEWVLGCIHIPGPG
jgi:hypothetical protein